MATKLVNGERVDVPADELSALQAEWEANADAPIPVPQLVRKLALVKACRQTTWGESDLWTQARAALALQSDEVQEDWDLAVEIPRDDPAFIALATGLGATSDDIDNVFRLAASLQ